MSSTDESKRDPESGVVEKQSFIAKYLLEVDTKRAYLPLLVCCFLSGLTDGTIYNGTLASKTPDALQSASTIMSQLLTPFFFFTAYGTFVSMQTGVCHFSCGVIGGDGAIAD